MLRCIMNMYVTATFLKGLDILSIKSNFSFVILIYRNIQKTKQKYTDTKKRKGALGVEPRTYRSAVDCSTTELYPRVMKKEEILQKWLLFVASPLLQMKLHVQFMFKSHLLIPNTVFCAWYLTIKILAKHCKWHL